MRKFTLICDYKGGTYISQFSAKSPQEALELWSVDFEYPKSTEALRKDLLRKLKFEHHVPIALRGVDNVWCVSISLIQLFLINIIETV